jgi:hypothetical protein
MKRHVFFLLSLLGSIIISIILIYFIKPGYFNFFTVALSGLVFVILLFGYFILNFFIEWIKVDYGKLFRLAFSITTFIVVILLCIFFFLIK